MCVSRALHALKFHVENRPISGGLGACLSRARFRACSCNFSSCLSAGKPSTTIRRYVVENSSLFDDARIRARLSSLVKTGFSICVGTFLPVPWEYTGNLRGWTCRKSLNTSFLHSRFVPFSIERSLRIDFSFCRTFRRRTHVPVSVFFPSRNIERKENSRLKDNGGGNGGKGAKGRRRSGTLNYEYPWKRRPTD